MVHPRGSRVSIEPNSLLLFQGWTIHKVKRRSRTPYERDIAHFLPDFVTDWEEDETASLATQLEQVACRNIRLGQYEYYGTVYERNENPYKVNTII
ncbi:hypothetical protein [Paenibacillus whitsoniae]|uniref:Uncharacterized protein n=1 Tax=Paenibacillus whitsoniae TaxID=2496558 RepID=A0A3S0AQT8_9BACL|nr:hypothetical protein [Paenibacillus whitsoniae]RTE10279.1 hypothetical protein EJQ19_08965 [Paenibacillus whitsoniae]